MTKKYVGLFSAELCSAIDNNMETIYGATCCDSFAEAMEQIEDYCGDELVSCNIHLLDQPVLTFSKEIYEKIKKEDF